MRVTRAPRSAAFSAAAIAATMLGALGYTVARSAVKKAAAGAGVNFRDLDRGELLTLLPLITLMFLLGLVPQLLAGLINPLVTTWAATLP